MGLPRQISLELALLPRTRAAEARLAPARSERYSAGCERIAPSRKTVPSSHLGLSPSPTLLLLCAHPPPVQTAAPDRRSHESLHLYSEPPVFCSFHSPPYFSTRFESLLVSARHRLSMSLLSPFGPLILGAATRTHSPSREMRGLRSRRAHVDPTSRSRLRHPAVGTGRSDRAVLLSPDCWRAVPPLSRHRF